MFYYILMILKIWAVIFYVMTSCSLLDEHQHLRPLYPVMVTAASCSDFDIHTASQITWQQPFLISFSMHVPLFRNVFPTGTCVEMSKNKQSRDIRLVKFAVFCGTRLFIAAFTSADH